MRSDEWAVGLADRLALRPKEAAKALGIGERTLRQIAPELPRVVRGGLVLYPVEGLREWLKREAWTSDAQVDRLVREELAALGEG